MRLHFIEPEGTKPGKRIFDVSLQDRQTMKKFDIASAGGAVVKEFRGVSVSRSLSIEFKPSDLAEDGTSKHPPVISGLEIIAE